jgi:flavin reductase (DIM6/NTAB) family NADH-FMN oxidoreductase RutF
MKQIQHDDILKSEKQFRVNMINGLLGYKTLNLLGTSNLNGVTNLCVVSSAFHLGANPPLIGIIMRPQREHNDTLQNIKATGEYTLNNVLPKFYKQAHQTSAAYPSEVSEFELCGFSEHYIFGFKAPFVSQSTIRIGLELREIVDMKINGTTLVVGEVVQILTEDEIIGDDGFINHITAGTVTVAGLDAYFLPEPLARLSYAKPDLPVQEIKEEK